MAKETARKGFRTCDCTPILFSIAVPAFSLAHAADGRPAILKAAAQEHLALFKPLLAFAGKALKQAAGAKSIAFQSCWRLVDGAKFDVGITTGREGLSESQLRAFHLTALTIARQVPAALAALYRAPDCMTSAQAAGEVERALRFGFSNGLLDAIKLQILVDSEPALKEPLQLGALAASKVESGALSDPIEVEAFINKVSANGMVEFTPTVESGMRSAQFNSEGRIALQLKFAMLGPSVRLLLRRCEIVNLRTAVREVRCHLDDMGGINHCWDAGALPRAMREALEAFLSLPRFGEAFPASESTGGLLLK